VGQRYLVDRPLHIGAERGAERRVGGQPGVVGRADEAVHEAPAQIGHVPHAGVQVHHGGLVAALSRVRRWAAHDLRPVGGEPLDVLGVLTWMGERVVQLGVRQAPRMVRGGQREEGRFPACELIQRRSHSGSMPRSGRIRAAGLPVRQNPTVVR
jgi:hypothetical protein